MAGSVNKAIIIGNLGRDPEVRFTPSGQAVANFSVATSDSWKDKAGQKQERTEWHRIVVWGRQAELVGEYLAKGRTVYVEGRLQTREWVNKEGAKQFTTEIVADRIQFLGGKDDGERQAPRRPASHPHAEDPDPPRGYQVTADDDDPMDDIPF